MALTTNAPLLINVTTLQLSRPVLMSSMVMVRKSRMAGDSSKVDAGARSFYRTGGLERPSQPHSYSA